MKNALDFFGGKSLFDSWFDNFELIPTDFTKSPKVNVKETDKAYEIEIANPGFTKDETKVEIKNGMLHVSMTCEEKQEDEKDKYHCKQWSKSSYSESWYLPENVIEDKISAKNVDGVLTVTLPKKEETTQETNKSRTIEIK